MDWQKLVNFAAWIGFSCRTEATAIVRETRGVSNVLQWLLRAESSKVRSSKQGSRWF